MSKVNEAPEKWITCAILAQEEVGGKSVPTSAQHLWIDIRILQGMISIPQEGWDSLPLETQKKLISQLEYGLVLTNGQPGRVYLRTLATWTKAVMKEVNKTKQETNKASCEDGCR